MNSSPLRKTNLFDLKAELETVVSNIFDKNYLKELLSVRQK